MSILSYLSQIRLISVFRTEKGASTLEYTFMAGLLSVASISAMTALKTEIDEKGFTEISDALNGGGVVTPPTF